ncbi:MAG TPA: class I SAM-dependent methyltransferase [Sedimentisphaerales bacterium]|nr:class I SAM-dependent methyltransferase [Sedimentisphaerales bacterium]
MKISGGLQEGGVVVGNVYDKYSSSNPFVRYAMQGFEEALSDLVARAAPGTIHEVGCGEGYWVLRWSRQGLVVRGTDASSGVIQLARENAADQGLNPGLFTVHSIYDLHPAADSADLIVCCEVLEHLERPEDALRILSSVVTKHLILSVPREPIFRFLNVARGKYLSRWGNTPGHIQQWSSKGFIRLVERYCEVVAIKMPLPWTMVLCNVRKS